MVLGDGRDGVVHLPTAALEFALQVADLADVFGAVVLALGDCGLGLSFESGCHGD